MPAAVVVTVVLAYRANAAGRFSGCGKVKVVLNAAAVVLGVVASTGISAIRNAVVPSHNQMSTSWAALAVEMPVPQLLTWMLSMNGTRLPEFFVYQPKNLHFVQIY